MLSELHRAQKNIYISLLATIVVLAGDLLLFHENETLMSAIGIAAFFGSLALFVVLDEREYRARERGGAPD